VDVNSWAVDLPDVAAVRPSLCPECGAAGRPLGRKLGIVGHGVRDRQVRGPAAPGVRASMRLVRARRYRCRGCSAVLVVVPRGVLARRHFAAGAIALALLRYSQGARVADIRRELGGQGDTAAWPTMRRWARAAASVRLWKCVRASPPDWGLRRRAERAAMTLLAHAPATASTMSVDARVFIGAGFAS
jgi:hypothetical protein